MFGGIFVVDSSVNQSVTPFFVSVKLLLNFFIQFYKTLKVSETPVLESLITENLSYLSPGL